jgi:hypothetical protein
MTAFDLPAIMIGQGGNISKTLHENFLLLVWKGLGSTFHEVISSQILLCLMMLVGDSAIVCEGLEHNLSVIRLIL